MINRQDVVIFLLIITYMYYLIQQAIYGLGCFDKCVDKLYGFDISVYLIYSSHIATLTLSKYMPLKIKHRKASKNKVSEINYRATKKYELHWNINGTLQTIEGEDSSLKREHGDFVAANGGRSCAALRKF